MFGVSFLLLRLFDLRIFGKLLNEFVGEESYMSVDYNVFWLSIGFLETLRFYCICWFSSSFSFNESFVC